MNNCNEELITFQDDLRNGMTLEDALTKHDLTLKEAVIECSAMSNKRGVSKGEYHHIYRGPMGKFKVSRQINNKRYCIMVEDLDIAVRIRNYFEEYGWTSRNLEYVKEKLQ